MDPPPRIILVGPPHALDVHFINPCPDATMNVLKVQPFTIDLGEFFIESCLSARGV